MQLCHLIVRNQCLLPVMMGGHLKTIDRRPAFCCCSCKLNGFLFESFWVMCGIVRLARLALGGLFDSSVY